MGAPGVALPGALWSVLVFSEHCVLQARLSIVTHLMAIAQYNLKLIENW